MAGKASKSLLLTLVALIVLGLLFMILGNRLFNAKPGNDSKLKVVTSFYPLYFFALQIGGEKADVTNITPAGAEPHDYELTSRQAAVIENSRLLILNGDGLEPWGNDMEKNLDSKRNIIVIAGEGLATQKINENGQEIIDPHVWLSPVLTQQMVNKIAAGFVKADPSNANYYEAKADNLEKRLSELNATYQSGLKDCAIKDIITSHAAFSYLASAYGLRQVSIAGLSPETEPSPQQLADIADLAKKSNIKYIFFESLVSPKLSETLANEIGAKTLVLNPLEGLSEKELSAGKDYFSIMEDNLANLRLALECK